MSLNTASQPLLVLGIESSCDETAAALVACDADGGRKILSQSLSSQIDTHARFGGVVPEVAARAHLEQMPDMVRSCLSDAGIKWDQVSAIAATAGPGLIGGVMVGLMTAKSIAAATNKPLLAVNHLAAHALSPRLTADIPFPYLLLLVSGGHCQLILTEGPDKFRRLGTTLDDAAGEAFDKVAKLLGLPYPGGPAVDRAAQKGNPRRFALPVPLLGRKEPNFSFSGLKTAVRLEVEKLGTPTEQDIADMAASFQHAVVTSLADRTLRALELLAAEGIVPTALVAAGGVAANSAIRAALTDLAAKHGLPFVVPPVALCTDNAAMVAWAGIELYRIGRRDAFDIAPRPRWPLDPTAEKVGMAIGKS